MSIELIGGLLELLGLNCQLGGLTLNTSQAWKTMLFSFWRSASNLIFAKGIFLILAILILGLSKFLNDIELLFDEKVRFISPRRVGSTPTSRFGWSWFTPLLKKYKRSLVLVFVASLLAQLFGLAIPLLIQQIIDKVLSQGNLSSLNVL